MKSSQKFTMYIDSNGVPGSHKSGEPLKGLKEVKVLKGQEIPKEIEAHVFMFNKEFIKLGEKPPEEIKDKKAPPIIPKRKYTEDSLYKVYDKDGMSGLKEIGKTFDPPVTDRSKNKLITEILAAQERIRRTGK